MVAVHPGHQPPGPTEKEEGGIKCHGWLTRIAIFISWKFQFTMSSSRLVGLSDFSAILLQNLFISLSLNNAVIWFEQSEVLLNHSKYRWKQDWTKPLNSTSWLRQILWQFISNRCFKISGCIIKTIWYFERPIILWPHNLNIAVMNQCTWLQKLCILSSWSDLYTGSRSSEGRDDKMILFCLKVQWLK
jgi:hypothetical protein